jgi:hypothetical protein
VPATDPFFSTILILALAIGATALVVALLALAFHDEEWM